MQNHEWMEDTPEGVILRIRLLPKAKLTEFVGHHDGAMKIRVQAPAVEGKANAALIAFLAAKFGIPKRHFSILRGNKDRQKIVQMSALTKQEAIDTLQRP